MPSAIAPAVKHPCFYASSRGKYGRIHLPVAPSCNIQCAYCRRDYDCPHEARPGVSAGVLSPAEACAGCKRSKKCLTSRGRGGRSWRRFCRP